MKKVLLSIASILLALILSIIAYFYIWGGEPYIDDFDEVSADYETVAECALDYYRAHLPKDEYIVIDIRDNLLVHEDSVVLHLTTSQEESLTQAGKKFGYLLVSKDAVFFRRDETGYYGLVYAKHPLAALYQKKLPQSGREYHRINSHWYEWGVWGI